MAAKSPAVCPACRDEVAGCTPHPPRCTSAFASATGVVVCTECHPSVEPHAVFCIWRLPAASRDEPHPDACAGLPEVRDGRQGRPCRWLGRSADRRRRRRQAAAGSGSPLPPCISCCSTPFAHAPLGTPPNRGSAWLARAVQRSSSRQATRLNRPLVSAAAQAEAAEPQAGGKQQKQQQKQKQQKQQGGSKKGEAKAITPKSEDFSR